MKTQVFAHKGIIGISSSTTADGLINDPTKPGQLGFVVDARHVEISPEAYEALTRVPRSHDDIGDIDVFKTAGDIVVFSWLGGPMRMVDPAESEGSSTHNAALMKPFIKTEGIAIPQEFLDAVDKRSASPTE